MIDKCKLESVLLYFCSESFALSIDSAETLQPVLWIVRLKKQKSLKVLLQNKRCDLWGHRESAQSADCKQTNDDGDAAGLLVIPFVVEP